MPEGKARVLALTGAGVLSQVGMTFLIVGLSFGKSPPPAPPPAVQAAAIAYSDGAVGGAVAGVAADPSPAAVGDSTPSYVTALGRSRPVHLSVPRVGIDTSLMDLGLQSDGTIEVPPDQSTAPAGWYRNLASPGEAGTAVIVGHLDSPQAPAVFFNLGAMRPGDHLSVARADGTTANFTVTEVGSYPHDQFPTEAVYGPSPTPVLRLVTCGGPFQRGVGYDGNVVVFADMDSSPGVPTDARAVAPAAAPAATLPAPVTAPAAPGSMRAPGREAQSPTWHAPGNRSRSGFPPSDTSSSGTSTSGTSSADAWSTNSTSPDVATADQYSTGIGSSSAELAPPQRRVSAPARVPRRVHKPPPAVYVPPEAD
jgi:hypothetical protein